MTHNERQLLLGLAGLILHEPRVRASLRPDQIDQLENLTANLVTTDIADRFITLSAETGANK